MDSTNRIALIAFLFVCLVFTLGIASINFPDVDDDTQTESEESGVKVLTGSQVPYEISYDTEVWDLADYPENADVEYELTHRDETAWVAVIAEKPEFGFRNIKRIALMYLEEASEEVEVLAEEYTEVNGNTVFSMAYRSVVGGLNYRYKSYYYTGSIGSIQVTTVSYRNTLEDNEADMLAVLDSFKITDPAAQSSATDESIIGLQSSDDLAEERVALPELDNPSVAYEDGYKAGYADGRSAFGEYADTYYPPANADAALEYEFGYDKGFVEGCYDGEFYDCADVAIELGLVEASEADLGQEI